jgi:RimJ/RimL family protein N-acetyltransferase
VGADLARARPEPGAFRARLGAYARELESGEAYPFFIFRRADHALVGAVRLFHVRRGVAQTGAIGYWVGQSFTRQGLMSDAVETLIRFLSKGWASTDLKPRACRKTTLRPPCY